MIQERTPYYKNIMGIESTGGVPRYQPALDSVMALTPESNQEDIDAALATFKKTFLENVVTREKRKEVLYKISEKANEYESKMRSNRKALSLAHKIREAVISTRNELDAAIQRGKRRV
jgi:acyl-CoA reductase-like NAD-dependent aldehyde dehydrogenase